MTRMVGGSRREPPPGSRFGRREDADVIQGVLHVPDRPSIASEIQQEREESLCVERAMDARDMANAGGCNASDPRVWRLKLTRENRLNEPSVGVVKGELNQSFRDHLRITRRKGTLGVLPRETIDGCVVHSATSFASAVRSSRQQRSRLV